MLSLLLFPRRFEDTFLRLYFFVENALGLWVICVFVFFFVGVFVFFSRPIQANDLIQVLGTKIIQLHSSWELLVEYFFSWGVGRFQEYLVLRTFDDSLALLKVLLVFFFF